MILPMNSTTDTWGDGVVRALENFFLIASIFSVKKENRLSADNEDRKDMLQVWRERRKSGMWERGNQPGKYTVINGQHEEPLSSVVLYLKWDQQDSFILFCCFLCLLQWLSGHRVYRVGFDQCFSFTKWEKKSKKVKGLLYAASFRSLLLVMIF